MLLIEPIQQLFRRLATYPAWQTLIELAVIWCVVYVIVRFVQGTRAAGALKGILVIFVVFIVTARIVSGVGGGSGQHFQQLAWLHDRLLAIIAIILVVVFQPELRRAFVRVGEARLFRSSPSDIAHVVDAVADAAQYLSKARFGAIIVLERQSGLRGLLEGGTHIGAVVSAPLLQTIFFPGTALHDLAVVIRGKTIEAAGVQLPLADPADMPDRSLGSRHRAAVGLTRECDALVVTVSEETGHIRVSERGVLSAPLSVSELRQELTRRLGRPQPRNENATETAQDTLEHPIEGAA